MIHRIDDFYLITEEPKFTTSLMRHAAKYAKELFATDVLIITGIPIAKRKIVAQELEQLFEKYREL